MKRIQNFNEFVNEGYLEKIGQKVSSWFKSIKDAIKKGLVKLIPSGLQKGYPIVSVFGPDGEGSVLDQVNKYYQGSQYAKVNNIFDPSTSTNESLVLEGVDLKYPIPDDIEDLLPEQIKDKIKRRLRELLKQVDAGNVNAAYEQSIKGYFIFGAPGIGKTQIVAQVISELGEELYGDPKALHLHKVDGEASEPVDFAGVPKVVDVEGPSDENPYGVGITRPNINPFLLPQNNGKGDTGGILFIDEMNRLDTNIAKLFLKLAQSRELGPYKLPSKFYIVAAGNRKIDEIGQEIKPITNALRERFTMVNLYTTPQIYRSYVESNPTLSKVVVPELLDFLEFQHEFFHNLDPKAGKTKYPTPRSWTDASWELKRVMDEYKAKGKEVPDSEIVSALTGDVGKVSASAFLNYYKVAKTIPIKDLELPFTNPDKAPVPADRKKKDGKIDTDYKIALLMSVVKRTDGRTLTPEETCNYAKWLIRTGKDDPSANELGGASLAILFKMHPYLTKDQQAVQCLGPLVDKWETDIPGLQF